MERIGEHIFQPVLPWVAEAVGRPLPTGWTAQSRMFPDVPAELQKVAEVLDHLQSRVVQRVWWQQQKDLDITLNWEPDPVVAALERWERKHPKCIQTGEIVRLREIGKRLVAPPVNEHGAEMVLI